MTKPKVILCSFEGSYKKYAYHCDLDVKVNDQVIVETKSGQEIVRVVSTVAQAEQAEQATAKVLAKEGK